MHLLAAYQHLLQQREPTGLPAAAADPAAADAAQRENAALLAVGVGAPSGPSAAAESLPTAAGSAVQGGGGGGDDGDGEREAGAYSYALCTGSA